MKIIAQTDGGFLLAATASEIHTIADMGNELPNRLHAVPRIGDDVEVISTVGAMRDRIARADAAHRHSDALAKEGRADTPLAPRGRSDRQIVDEVNTVARQILLHAGYDTDEGFLVWECPSPRSERAWESAVAIYEALTGTEVHDALLSVQEEDEAA